MFSVTAAVVWSILSSLVQFRIGGARAAEVRSAHHRIGDQLAPVPSRTIAPASIT
jgi:hypothetical protein